MSEYYTPNLLFRQNAIRHSPKSSPNSSHSDLRLGTPAWMLMENANDSQVINQSCSLNRLNIKSNYWKIPDNNMNLTAMDVNTRAGNNAAVGLETPTLAISSGNKLQNLFIYQLDTQNNYLTHNNTISLPNIHSMKWVPEPESHTLATGNNAGYAHLVSIPRADAVDENAEIIKKFNHAKYLKPHTTSNITRLNFLDEDNLLTLYQGHLFRWDVTSAKSKPTSISTLRGARSFDVIPSKRSTVAISGDFGVSLFDLRQSDFKVPSSILRNANKEKLVSNLIKWNPNDEYVFAASHMDGAVRLWDTRMQGHYGVLQGHGNKTVTSIEWNNDDIFTGARDGNIVHWDLSNTADDLMNCTLKEGLSSVKFNSQTNSLDDMAHQRQCGTVLPASNTNITCMASISDNGDDCKILSIDGSSFFGVHSKIYDAIQLNINSEKLYYNASDLSLLMKSEEKVSLETLVEGDDELSDIESLVDECFVTKPLEVSRKPTIDFKTVVERVNELDKPTTLSRKPTLLPASENLSSDTLFDEVAPVTTDNDGDEFEFQFSVDNSPGNSSDTLHEFSDNDSVSTNPTLLEEVFSKHEAFDVEFDFLGISV